MVSPSRADGIKLIVVSTTSQNIVVSTTSRICCVYYIQKYSLRSQSSTTTANHAEANTSKCRSVGCILGQRPHIATSSIQGAPMTTTAQSNIPPKLAVAACISSPRSKYAHAVVPPHKGQTCPVNSWKVHGVSPNCSCVPKPRGSGSRLRAITNTVSPSIPATASSKRCCFDRHEGWRILGIRDCPGKANYRSWQSGKMTRSCSTRSSCTACVGDGLLRQASPCVQRQRNALFVSRWVSLRCTHPLTLPSPCIWRK